MRVDARGDAQQHLLAQRARGGLLGQGDQLVAVVHDEAAHAPVKRVGDVRVGLAVAVVVDLLRRKARGQSRADLAGGDRVDPQSLLGHDAVDLPEGGGLARIKRQRVLTEGVAEGRAVHPAVAADAILVHQIQRRAVGVRQRVHALAGEEQRAVGGAGDVLTKHEGPSLYMVFINLAR